MPRKLLFLLLWSGAAFAVPNIVRQEGYLLDDQEQLIEGVTNLRFSLYEQLVGGAALWSEEHQVEILKGHYAVDLGSLNPLPSFQVEGGLYLSLSLEGVELQPRYAFQSSPYALVCDNAIGDLRISSLLIGDQQVIDDTGHWVGPAVGNITGGGYATPEALLAALQGVDGQGSGLNTDLLDDLDSSAFLRTGEDLIASLLGIAGEGSGLNADRLDGLDSTEFYSTGLQVVHSLGGEIGDGSGLNFDRLDGLEGDQLYHSGEQVLLALQGLGGAGSSLNADLLDGMENADFLIRNDPSLNDELMQMIVPLGGEGSGLDVDELDGLDSSLFMRTDADTGTVGDLSVGMDLEVGADLNLGADAQLSGNAKLDTRLGVGVSPETQAHIGGDLRADLIILNPLNNAPLTPQSGMIYFNTQTKEFLGYDGQNWRKLNSSGKIYANCQSIKEENPNSADGLYWIDPKNNDNPIQVWCDMTTDDGGWMVVARASETNGAGGDYEFRAAVGDHSLIGMHFDHGSPMDAQYTIGLEQLIPNEQKNIDIQYYCYDRRNPVGTNYWTKAINIDVDQLRVDLAANNPDLLYNSHIINKDGDEADGFFAFFHRERVNGLQCGNSHAGQSGMKFDCGQNGQNARVPGIVWYLTHYDGNYSEVNSCGTVGGSIMPYYAGEVRIRWDWKDLPYESCQAIREAHPEAISQAYWIDVDGNGPLTAINAYCDMDVDQGAWIRLNLFSRQWGNSQGFGSDPLGGYGERVNGANSQRSLDNLNSCVGDSQVNLQWADERGQILSAEHIAALNLRITEGFTTDYRIFDADGGGDWDKIKGCHEGQVVMWGDGDERENGANQQWVGPYAVDHLTGIFTIGIYAGNSDASGYNASLPQHWYFRALDSSLGSSPEKAAPSCLKIKQVTGLNQDGVYWLDLDGLQGGAAPVRLFCDMGRDGGGWTLVGQINVQDNVYSGWLRSYRDVQALQTPEILAGDWASVDAIDLAVNRASELRLSNPAGDRWLKWPMHPDRTVNTWWNHAAGAAAIAAASQDAVTTVNYMGSDTVCYHNKYGIMALSGHGGSYPSATINTNGNTGVNDWCMAVGVMPEGTDANGFTNNWNGYDAPYTENGWPNDNYRNTPLISVWLR